MKIIILAILGLLTTQTWAQDAQHAKVPLLGDKAPSFTAESTTGTVYFPEDYGRKWKILFSHPADFTPVCSSELLELAAMQNDFKDMDARLIVLSTDNLETHNQWVKSLETIRYKDRQPVDIGFPLVADNSREVARKYGMIHPNTNSTEDVRGVYIIDPDNRIRAMQFYPMAVGRNMEEIKRTLAALQTADQAHVLTPANWQPGGDVLLPYSGGSSAQVEGPSGDPDLYQLIWYMTFRKMAE